MRHHTFVFLLLIYPVTGFVQARTDKLLQNVFAGENDSLFQSVIRLPEIYRFQIIYTRIDRDKHNNPSFTNYYYNYDSLRYFNPASTVKMPLHFYHWKN